MRPHLREPGQVGREDEDVRGGLEVEEIEMGEVEIDVLDKLVRNRVEGVEAGRDEKERASQLAIARAKGCTRGLPR